MSDTLEHKEGFVVGVAATFTIEPIEPFFAFWMNKLSLGGRAKFALFNQVFQELLSPGSILRNGSSAINALFVRVSDWTNGNLASTASEFVDALQSSAGNGKQHLVFLCPSDMRADGDRELADIEGKLSERCAAIPGVNVISYTELLKAYPVKEVHDPYQDKLAKIPYTAGFFAALGTMLARRVFRVRTPPHKVLVLDCDNTLWRGVCAEDGAGGIRMEPANEFLQHFAIKQQQSGMLLCLCSKNDSADVAEAFAQHPEMPLRPEHIISSRVNWLSKPENLRSLANELQLGLDSFIFVDDNPLECAQVRAECPEVLVLQCPATLEEVQRLLTNVWQFDKLNISAEDRERTDLYRSNIERERERKNAPSLRDFVSQLNLKINIQRAAPADLNRAAELTMRTNQFNTTTIRRSTPQLQELLNRSGWRVLTVRVKDRFGDYGLVGLAIAENSAGALRVDSFLLSCRVLGRGVEHAMARKLGDLALEMRVASVDFDFRPTKRNQPAQEFLEKHGSTFKLNDGSLYRFPAEVARNLNLFSSGA